MDIRVGAHGVGDDDEEKVENRHDQTDGGTTAKIRRWRYVQNSDDEGKGQAGKGRKRLWVPYGLRRGPRDLRPILIAPSTWERNTVERVGRFFSSFVKFLEYLR